MKKRILVIGDIHGALRALEQVLERAAITENDTLVFLGDYVDGWSESKQVIDRLISLSESNSCLFIRGNHDTWCEEWLRFGLSNEKWLIHGGKATVESYASITEEERTKHLEFYHQMYNYFIDRNNRLFIHAGFSSMHGPEQEVYATNYSWDRTLWEMALTMDKRVQKDSVLYPKRLKLFSEIFIGHTPTINYHSDIPMNGINVWNVDTGSAFTGKLSIMDIETKEFWQSDVVQTLYPDERGRN
ncbi:metallophosphoesterase family protein [Fluviicola sp.]|uniref:metallophosphoesterase family protein n=1 Tax=Fluviicola sp. TaxID=1917219 RepID=UPI0031DD11A2